MKVEEIERLLAEFYEGNTNEQEEELLKEAFRTEEVPEHLQKDKKLFFKTFSVHGLFINSRFLFIPFRRRGKGFCYTTRKKKWKKNENTNSTSPRVRLFQDISNPLFKIQFCNVFRLQLKLHQHLRCGESVFLL